METRSFSPNYLVLILCVAALQTACTRQTSDLDALAKAPASSQVLTAKVIDKPSYVTDQLNTDFLQPFYYNILFAPMGQEFTPSLHAMDAVELRFDDASCSLAGSDGGYLRLLIRNDAINGTIIGTSETIHFPNCFVGIMRFNFPAYVPLVPGQRYVMQPEYVSGHLSSFFLNNYGSSYEGGRFIFQGAVQPAKDLWFREGLYNFIALNKEQAKDDGWMRLVRHDGTPFKNKGDCIQYINTGR